MNKHRRRLKREYAHLFGKGWSGGYSEYRYGPKDTKPVSLPPIFSQGKRDHVADQVVEILRDWKNNPWEGEAPARHGLRAALTIQGYGWARSDEQAGDVVRVALNKLGRGKETRPTPDEAAPEHLIPRENCAVCYRPLDAQSIAMGLRYCGPEHARFAWVIRSYADGWYNSQLGTAATSTLLTPRRHERHRNALGPAAAHGSSLRTTTPQRAAAGGYIAAVNVQTSCAGRPGTN